MIASPLYVLVPPTEAARAERMGFVVRENAPADARTPDDVLRAWAHGATTVGAVAVSEAALLALRPLALFAATFAPVLTDGVFRDRVPATGGLQATERSLREVGSIVFVHNPTAQTVTGAVFPALPEVTLAPGETLAWVHDAVLGSASHYLAAYAGLVKSDAAVLCGHIRPDPYVGAQVVVYSAPGTTREVVLFGGGRGESLLVPFTDTPSVFALAESQVVALPTALAERFWRDAATGRALIGPSEVLAWGASEASIAPGPLPLWQLAADGTVLPLSLPTTDENDVNTLAAPGWYEATIGGDDTPVSARLVVEGATTATAVWLNGAPTVSSGDVTLAPGDNHLLIYHDGSGTLGPVTLIPDGGCVLLEITRWRHRRPEPVTVRLAQSSQ